METGRNEISAVLMLLLDRGAGPEQVCLGSASSVWVLDFVQERFHNMSPGDYECMTWIPARRIWCCGGNRQIHTDYRVLWRKRDGVASLSRGERLDSCFDGLLLLFWVHYIEDDPHLLCTGSLLQKTKERVLLITKS